MNARPFVVIVAAVCGLAACAAKAGPAGADGKDGVDGTDGVDGKDGLDGKNGVDGMDASTGNGLSIKSAVRRAARVIDPAKDTLKFSLRYTAITYASGDAFVTCSVTDGFTTSSQTYFCDASQKEAVSGLCSVVLDKSGSFGFWEFEHVANGYIASNYDPGSTNDGFVFLFDGPSSTDDGCDVRTF